MLPPALDVRALTGPADGPVLHDVSLRVRRGGTHVVLGPIHSGKSMLLRHVLGLERARHGTIVIDGVALDAARPNDTELRRLRRRVGVVFEGSALVSRLSILENVELPLVEHTPAGADAARETARRLLAEAGIEHDVGRMPATLSRLERRRAALARALALEPAILLLDEPAHGLDAHAAAELDDTVGALQARYGCAVLICSHDVRYAFRSPGAISVLDQGRIVAQGDWEHLRGSPHEAVRRLVDRRGAA